MSIRYVLTSRSPDGEVVLPEGDDVRLVAALDRGLLVDAEPDRAEQFAAAGLRVKAFRDPHVINLFSYRIDTESGTPPELPEAMVGGPTGDATEGDGPDLNHLVQLVGPAQESWLAVLAERGVRVVEAVGPFAYYVRADADTVAALQALPFVEWAGRLEPAYKVNPVLLAADDAEADEASGLGPIEAVDIGVLADGDVEGVAALVEEARWVGAGSGAGDRRRLPQHHRPGATGSPPDPRPPGRRALDRRRAHAAPGGRALRPDRLRGPGRRGSTQHRPRDRLRRQPHGPGRQRFRRHHCHLRQRCRHQQRGHRPRRRGRAPRVRGGRHRGCARRRRHGRSWHPRRRHRRRERSVRRRRPAGLRPRPGGRPECADREHPQQRHPPATNADGDPERRRRDEQLLRARRLELRSR